MNLYHRIDTLMQAQTALILENKNMTKTHRNNVRLLVLMIVTFTLIAAVVPYTAEAANETVLFTARNSDINIDFPTSLLLNAEEINPDEAETGNFEHIVTADLKNSKAFSMDLYYSVEESDNYFYFHENNKRADEYYETIGENAVIELYSDIEGNTLQTLVNKGYFTGEWVTYLKLAAITKDEATGTERKDLVYITGNSVLYGDSDVFTVNKIFVFSGKNAATLPKDMENDAEYIINSFYDYGYDEEKAGVGNDGNDESFAEIKSSISSLWSLVFIAFIIYIIKRKSGKKNTKNNVKNKNTGRYRRAEAQEKKKPWSKKTHDIEFHVGEKTGKLEKRMKKTKNEPFSETRSTSKSREKPVKKSKTDIYSKTDAARRDVQKNSAKAVPVKGSDRNARKALRREEGERKYMESLNTLLASGLLTRSERNEMLERHRRNSERGKRR